MKQVLFFLSILFLFACSPEQVLTPTTNQQASERAAGVTVQIQNVNVVAGQPVEAKFSVSGFTNIACFQYAMLFDTAGLEYTGATFTDSIPGYSIDCCFGMYYMGYAVEAGEVRTAWISPNGYGVTVTPNATTHSLFFTAKKAGNLAQYFAAWPDHPILGAVAYEGVPLNPVPLTITYLSLPASPPAGGNGNPKKKKKHQ